MRRLSALTVRGRAFLAAGLAASLSALILGQGDLLRVGVFLLALPLVSLAAVLRARYRLSVERLVEPPRVPVGQPTTVQLVLSNLSRLPTGLLLVEDRVPYVLGARPRFVLDRIPARWTRDLDYAVRCETRGVYELGPLSLRLTDPFGLVEITRAFRSTDVIVVTPQVVALPALRLRGEWSGSGEHRPRSVAAAGDEDATIREYRDGDDLRRVHWRATAHHDRLMVRREEQPWQSRCTVLLDTRAAGHVGSGTSSSFEWAVSATASIALHQLQRGYAVRLVTDEGGTAGAMWHDAAAGPGAGDALLLDALAVVEPTQDASVGRYPRLLAGIGGSPGLLIAVIGDVDSAEAALVARLSHGTGLAVAVVLETATWGRRNAASQARFERAVHTLRQAGWRVVTAHSGDPVAAVWQQVGPSSAGSTRQPVGVAAGAAASGRQPPGAAVAGAAAGRAAAEGAA